MSKPPVTDEEYEELYKTAKILSSRLTSVMSRARLISTFKDSQYIPASQKTGVPWYVIAAIQNEENGSDVGVFKAAIHNGEKIIGTNKKTTLVPKGRGPFATWIDAVVDAFKGAGSRDWTLGGSLAFMERYNGLGYRSHGVNSPYLWAMTDQYTKGHYAGDGNWQPDQVSQNFGAVAILKALEILGVIDLGTAKTTPPDVPAPTGSEIFSTRDMAFLLVANSLSYKPQAMDVISHWKKQHPGSDPRYRMLVDFSLKDTLKRAFLIDCDNSSVEPHRVSHGSGSDPNQDGIATVFSDKNGSHASMLGIYRVAETYIGKHGYSCKIDGEDQSNKDARSRDVVIHPADYVSDKDGVLHTGDSWGCFALDPAKATSIIDKLKNGSPLYAFDLNVKS